MQEACSDLIQPARLYQVFIGHGLLFYTTESVSIFFHSSFYLTGPILSAVINNVFAVCIFSSFLNSFIIHTAQNSVTVRIPALSTPTLFSSCLLLSDPFSLPQNEPGSINNLSYLNFMIKILYSFSSSYDSLILTSLIQPSS